MRDLRHTLLENAGIASKVRELRGPISSRDCYVSFGSLLLGTVGQGWAVSSAPFSIPLFLFLQLVGLAGLQSLAHESWHHRAHPNRAVDRWIREWAVGSILLVQNRALAADHKLHHRMPGEPEDPSNTVWAQSEAEMRRSILQRLLILPMVVRLVRGLLTGRRPGQNWSGDAHRARPSQLLGMLLVHGVWAGGLLWVSVPALVVGYVIPLPIASSAAHLREYREHARLSGGRTAVYDLLCPQLERVLIPGGYFNLHALHHTFPEIPQRRLPQLYRFLERTIDMQRDYYGFSPQVGRKQSYLRRAAAVPDAR